MNLTHRFRARLLTTALCAALSAIVMPLHAAPQAQDGAPLAEPSKSLYWQGHELLGQSDWSGAFERFRALEQELAKSKTEPADAAIYWQAYALTQAKRTREATSAIDRLHQSYPESPWLDDAQALLPHERRGEEGNGRRGERDPRDADAMMALDALLAGSNEKAVPLLQRVLSGNQSDRVKGRAMFVLSQIDPAAADAAVDGILKGNGSARLKSEAIRMLAAGGRRESLDRLLPLYRASQDEAVRRGIQDAFLIGDRPDLMLQLIQNEADPKQRRHAIDKLGAMNAEKELEQLYAGSKDPSDRRAILRSLGVAGATQRLVDVARSEKDPQVRAEAIRAVAIAGGKDVGARLVEFYQPGEPEVVREAAIQGLMIADATDQMIAIYRKETDPEMRRKLLTQISATDPDAALELIDQALKQ